MSLATNHTSMVPRILIVDDDPAILKSIQRFLRPHPYWVFSAASAAEGMEILKTEGPFHLVISDYLMPDTTGDKFLHDVAITWPDVRRVILSAYADRSVLLSAINEGGVHRFLTKPWHTRKLLEVIEELVADYDAEESARAGIRELAQKHQLLVVTNQQLEDLVSQRTTDLEQHRQQLQEANSQLRQLGSHMEELREDERRSIAREIHDELAQSLSAIKLDVSTLLNKVKEPKLHSSLGGIKEQVDHTLATIQRILAALRPVVLDELGLAAALEWLASDFSRRNCIPVTLNCSLDSKLVPIQIATSIFRITQEAFTNIMRHSGAYRATLRAWQEDDIIYLVIEDNGIGIPDKENRRPNSFGILGMQERAALCNGSLSVSSLESGGTQVMLQIPGDPVRETIP